MPYKHIIQDLNQNRTPKRIGTDKGLAKIGDGIVNLAYSIAKSIYLTNNSVSNKISRTGQKVSKQILSNALKNADMKNFARSRADAHDLADTVEAIVAYVWLNEDITLTDIIDYLVKELEGDLNSRATEISSATVAFTKLLIHLKEFLPEE